MPSPSRISRLTRSNVFDWLALSEFRWSGRLQHPEFLNRLYDLQALPSKDHRYKSASGDIHQHTVNNDDWEDDWVFGDDRFHLRDGSDTNFLNFLVETVHPLVRNDSSDAAVMVDAYNNTLRPEGFELCENGHVGNQIVYSWREVSGYHTVARLPLAQSLDVTQNEVLLQHLKRIDRDLHADPSSAIASSKNLIESQCKIVLADLGAEFSERDELPGLFAKVAAELSINADSVAGDSRGSAAMKKAMRSLFATVQSIAEARNAIGDGHGSGTISPATPRHAKLVFNSTVAISQFIADTWNERPRP
ncbi:hypothetical protein D9V32_11180 [Mycetocola tolaasinivorans]|uniref:Abortive infection protein-like C-terminal domain-containing protein n=1 Tax=Mycetocola tolaasinivorans TaxID=76635 RepID=A0A3L7A4J5_9MICO|nr:abortive infection family protein [Mycetocola tolaasinivorans]RLP74985.1 hypothetical protein D9V32_11180 [Mycetocola tolaasinivorans]